MGNREDEDTIQDAVGVKIQPDYRRIFPDFAGRIRDLFPRGRLRIGIKVTRPIRFPRDTDHRDATRRLEQALREL